MGRLCEKKHKKTSKNKTAEMIIKHKQKQVMLSSIPYVNGSVRNARHCLDLSFIT